MAISLLDPLPDFDIDGFLAELDAWDEGLARRIAALDGLGDLDERQIVLLHRLRENYLRNRAAPALSHVCRVSGYDPDCMTQLFPNAREAWRVAGLPNPGEEAKAYM